MLRCRVLSFFLLALAAPTLLAQVSTLPANGLPAYQELRQALPSGETVAVKDIELKRDAGTFHFIRGSFAFYSRTGGRDTGAVFHGDGIFDLAPANAGERHSMQTLLKTENLHLEFSEAVLRFTDDTAADLRKGPAEGGPSGAGAKSAAMAARDLFRGKLNYNLEERLLTDLLSNTPGGFFMAEFKTSTFGKQYVYMVDPDGAERTAPDQVELLTSGPGGDFDVAAALPLGDTARRATLPVKVSAESIDTTIAKNGYLTGKAEMKLTSLRPGLRVVPLPLYPTLRVSSVSDSKGNALDFIQEDKDKDPQFAVILPEALRAGDETALTFRYEGKDLVTVMGGGNYYPVGRESWYPAPGSGLSQYVTYDLTFRIPKDVQIAATGNKVSEKIEGGQLVSVWHTNEPIAVAGFNIGKFKEAEVQTPDKKMTAIAYVNSELPDYLERFKNTPFLGTLNSTSMVNTALNEGSAALQVYEDYFGLLPYDHLALTQQAACTYGQSWPMLVYLPVCYFFDSTYRHILGLDQGDPGYWNEVVAHEVSHQWWGQMVGFASYRDQWMSEGFAQWSASLYLKSTRKSMDEYQQFWRDQQKRVVEKTVNGKRAIDSGPLVMGHRLNSSKGGEDMYQRLIYSKGGYVAHMLEMEFYSNEHGSEAFKKTMQDFCATYRNRPATTEDFKAVVEKHMPKYMDLDHNGKLDWFFNEWVFGTEIPHYSIESSVEGSGADAKLHFKAIQSGVSPSFKMLVPIYLETKDGTYLRLGMLPFAGEATIEKTIAIPASITNPKRAVLNAYEDVLSD